MINKAEVLEELNALRLLGNDWDDEGALSIKEEAIRGAEAFLEAIEGISGVWEELSAYPCGDGNVLLYWRKPLVRFQVEFNGGVNCSFILKRSKERHDYVPNIEIEDAIRELKIFLNS